MTEHIDLVLEEQSEKRNKSVSTPTIQMIVSFVNAIINGDVE